MTAKKNKKGKSDTNGGGGSDFSGIADALDKFRASEGYGTNEPITYGDFRHVAEQLAAGRNADGSKAKAKKGSPSATPAAAETETETKE